MKHRKKGVLSFILATVLSLGMLTACGNKNGETDTQDSTATPATTEPTATAEVVHKSANGIETKDDGSVREDLTSVDLVNEMGNGINLGNTMEAYGHKDLGVTAEVSKYETLWGMPVTTQEMITAMKEAGFDTLRIPVAWTNMMDYENGDYTINEAYLNRVEEIINYARNVDMYVIINDHWDGGWWGMFGSATKETQDKAMTMYTSMWKQIAERYAEYSDYVIFESANEELGNRLNDTDVATDSGALSEDECYEMCLKINQAFVDTVRATGGNNAQRFLLIAGFDTNVTNTCDDRFIMPTDTAKNKLMVSVHYYDPDGYCQRKSISTWGSKKEYEDQNTSLESLSKFTEAGYGVVIGEYGVLIEGETEPKENTSDYYTNFLSNCDYYGYCPVLWDCSSMFDRTKLGFIDDTIAKIYSDHSLASQAGKTQDQIKEEAKKTMDDAYAAATETEGVSDDEAVAWIMYNSSDWAMLYSVGDVYDPSTATEGIDATDVAITGEGTYTVALDFTKTQAKSANSVVFSAVGIANGETLYPGYIITVDEIKINGETYEPKGKSYTTSDDEKCTRVNLYNEWVTKIPDSARTADGDVSDVTSNLLDAETLGNVETIEVTFTYGPAK